MIATHVLASGAGTNYTLVGIMLAIFVPVFGALAAILVGYFRLQRHRAEPSPRAERSLRA
jgi:heme/copper-type cytochrome/quinol oxidase subunit 2